MKPARFAYVAPRSLDEALAALAQGDDETKLLAGGQSLIPLLNMRLASPKRLVDLGRVSELAYVTERDGGYSVGAMTRQSALERDGKVLTIPIRPEYSAATKPGHMVVGVAFGKPKHPNVVDMTQVRLVNLDQTSVVSLPGYYDKRYIQAEEIPIVPLYFAAKRPFVERDGMMIAASDPRLELLPGETKQEDFIRFRTLGCFPLTGAIRSTANTLEDIIAELEIATVSERQGRAIDRDQSGSMEKKKREGYF